MAKAKARKKVRFKISDDLCKGCRLCVEFCPKGALVMTTDKLNRKGVQYVECARPEVCSGCMCCTLVCPDAVIELSEES